MYSDEQIEKINLTGRTVSDTARKYIPQKLLQSVNSTGRNYKNDEEVVQAILSNSDNMLRMYGTARELLLNLKKYQNFPLSHRRFDFDPKAPYSKVPIVYKNMDGESFMNKADTYWMLQYIVPFDQRFKNLNSFSLFLAMQSILLKSHDEKIAGVCEYFKLEKDWLPKLQNEFLQFHQKFLTQESSTIRDDWDFEKALKMFKAVLPVWKEQEYSEFESDLKTFFDSKRGNFKEVSIAFMCFAEYLKGFILATPEMFLPYEKETNPNCPIVVRVFESHGVHFVMKSELFNAINIRNPNSKRLECKENNGKLMTMSYEKVQRKYKDRIGNIEFIKCPIQRTDHKAVPIMTPTGGHCILATDFLFEILNELIFTHRIFQKIGTGNWNVLRRFFLQMTNFFSPHHKSIFFVTLEEQEKQKEKFIECWKKYENIPAKYVRNAKANGFTVQNLKNELANLGLTELFPEIQYYAEAVYSEVLKTKKGESLRTCDLFKAVEKCLLHCIFKRFPTLYLFLHTQNACHVFPEVKCNFSQSLTQTENKFKNTTWKEPNFKKIMFAFYVTAPDNMYLYENIFPDGTKLTNSYNRFFTMEQIRKNHIKYFIYDTQDSIYFEKNMKSLKPRRLQDEYRYNLDAFQKFYPEKKFYIRAIPSTMKNREVSKRVFAEEVLDLIPVVLRQQNTPLSENDDRLAKYRNKWETNDKDLETTISLTEFWYILEEFDVDKTRITICPDPVYELTMPKMVKEMTMRTLNVISPWGEQVMRSEQAVFHIFQVVYCSVNWTTDSCKTHENCLKELKCRTISSMRVYSEMDEGTYVSVAHVESVINQLKKHCSFQLQSKTLSPLAELQQMEFDDLISKEEAISNCRKFGITEITQAAYFNNMAPTTTVIAVRDLYLSAWSEEFFDFETSDLKDLIANESQFKSVLSEIPNMEELEALKQKDWADILKQIEYLRIMEESEAEKYEKERCIQKTSLEDIQKTPVLVEALVPSVDTQKSSESDKASDDIQAVKVLEKAPEVETPSSDDLRKSSVSQEASSMEKPSSDDAQKTNPIKKLSTVDTNQSECCEKCSRTSEWCTKAQNDLKMAENKLEKYEKKAKRTEEVEIQMREMEAEMKKMKKERKERELAMEKKEKENEDLKRNMLKLEFKHAKIMLAEKNHSISQNNLLEKITKHSEELKKEKEKNELLQSERIDELTAQLEQRNEKLHLMEVEKQQKEEVLRNEIRQKERGFEELRAALTIMSNEKDSFQREIRTLRETIASIPEAPPTPADPGSSSDNPPAHQRYTLFRFQRIKDSLSHKKQLNQAKEMVEKVKSTTDIVGIRQIADYEYYQFEWKLLEYVKEVELNIQTIKETCDVSKVTPLPDSPEFSQRFINMYYKSISGLPILLSDIDVSDSDCYICSRKMTSDQKTLQCEKCRKTTHYECVAKWFKIQRSCPQCRQ